MGPSELKGRYEKYWRTMKPLDETTRYDRPLFQLGLPASDRLVVWFGSADPKVTVEAYRFRLCRRAGDGCVPEGMRDVEPGELRTGKYEPWNTARVEISGASGMAFDQDVEYDLEVLDPSGTPVSRLYARTAPRADSKAHPFSFLVFSCNKPFSAIGQNGDFRPEPGFTASHINSWNLMRLRSEGRLSSRTYRPNETSGVRRPSFALGLGDQIYIDPDNPSDNASRRRIRERDSVLAFFVGAGSDDWLISDKDEDLQYALREVYYRNFALPPLDQVARHVPFVLAWDDHEIRDGWGSHQDEKDANGRWRRYFTQAQASFKAFQFSRNQVSSEQRPVTPGSTSAEQQQDSCEDRGDMDFAYDWGRGVHFFVLDTRSSRDASKKCVLSSAQFRRLRDWLARGSSGEGDLFILANNAPLGARLAKASPWYARLFNKELQDDVADSWIENRAALDELTDVLAKHFDKQQRDRLIILSGDSHESGLYSLKLSGRHVGWEVVSSGVANYSKYSDASQLGTIGTNAACLDTGRRLCPQFYGSIKGSPSFAEIAVDPARGSASLVFYPSVADPNGPDERRKSTSNHLLNLVPELLSASEEKPRDYWALYGKWSQTQEPWKTGVEPKGPVIVPLFDEQLQVPKLPKQVWRGGNTVSPLHDAMSAPRSVNRREDENASHWFEVFAPSGEP